MNRLSAPKRLAHYAVLGALLVLTGCAEPTATEPQSDEPAPAPPADPMAAVQAVHDRVLVLDAHVDVVPPGTTSRYGDSDGSSKVTPAKLAAGGVDAVVMAVAVGPGPRTPDGDAEARAIADAELAGVLAIAADPTNNVVIARSAEELRVAHDNDQIAVLLGFQNARMLEGRIEAIDEFYDAGVRVFALTHLGHNDFADSSRPVYHSDERAYEPTEEHGGLSDLGRAAIARVNALGGVVDVSQLSRNATLQAIELSTTPVIASHSNVQSISDVARNLSDTEIDHIGATGGVVHVAAFTAYLLELSSPQLVADIKTIRRVAGIDERYTYPYELYWEIAGPDAQQTFLTTMRERLGPANIELLIDHIDYVAERVGVDHVGLATDFNHGGGIEGFGNASEALNVTAGLLARGYTADEIEKIWSGNFLRVLRAAEDAVRPR